MSKDATLKYPALTAAIQIAEPTCLNVWLELKKILIDKSRPLELGNTLRVVGFESNVSHIYIYPYIYIFLERFGVVFSYFGMAHSEFLERHHDWFSDAIAFPSPYFFKPFPEIPPDSPRSGESQGVFDAITPDCVYWNKLWLLLHETSVGRSDAYERQAQFITHGRSCETLDRFTFSGRDAGELFNCSKEEFLRFHRTCHSSWFSINQYLQNDIDSIDWSGRECKCCGAALFPYQLKKREYSCFCSRSCAERHLEKEAIKHKEIRRNRAINTQKKVRQNREATKMLQMLAVGAVVGGAR